MKTSAFVFVASGVISMLLLTAFFKEAGTEDLLKIAAAAAFLSAWASDYFKRLYRGKTNDKEG